MRRRWIMAAALALTGCGTRTSLPVDPEAARLVDFCNAGEWVYVGSTDCTHVGQAVPNLLPAVEIGITGTDRANLGPGAVLEIEPASLESPTFGYWVPPPSEPPTLVWKPLTGGTIEFTTFDFDTGATGSYDVQFEGGEASGTFSAEACPRPSCAYY